MTLQDVKILCESFLESYFGPEDSSDVVRLDEQRSRGLRLVSLGNPERTVQGELVHYLRDNKANAVSECGVTDDSARYSTDIVVFDAQWLPLCAIELKHYSANQGSIDVLLHNLIADSLRHREGPQGELPLAQIGLYTEITSAFHRNEYDRPFGLYRFIAAYCKGVPRQTVVGQRPRVPRDFGGQLIVPSTVSFELPGTRVVGKVGWILRMVEAQLNAVRARENT